MAIALLANTRFIQIFIFFEILSILLGSSSRSALVRYEVRFDLGVEYVILETGIACRMNIPSRPRERFPTPQVSSFGCLRQLSWENARIQRRAQTIPLLVWTFTACCYACNCRDRNGPERLLGLLNEANTEEIGMLDLPSHSLWEDRDGRRDMKLWIFFRIFERFKSRRGRVSGH
jgi:hypothetical protein